MAKNDNEIRNEYKEISDAIINKVCELLNNCDDAIYDYFADMCAALCHVDTHEMLTTTKRSDVIHARWFYWHAYRYMTNKPYKVIADMTSQRGRLFTEQSISNSVNKMSLMIRNEPVWSRRWSAAKRIIKVINKIDSSQEHTFDENKITVIVPAKMKDKINIIEQN